MQSVCTVGAQVVPPLIKITAKRPFPVVVGEPLSRGVIKPSELGNPQRWGCELDQLRLVFKVIDV